MQPKFYYLELLCIVAIGFCRSFIVVSLFEKCILQNKKTALHYAASVKCYLKNLTIEYLINEGADINAVDEVSLRLLEVHIKSYVTMY